MMDAVYQAVKNFFMSFINLFVAVIDLMASLVNLLAFALGKLHPRICDTYAEMRREKRERDEIQKALGKKPQAKEGIEEIRRKLEEQVTDKETYYQVYSYLEEEGAAGYGMILAVLFPALSICTALLFYRRDSQMCVLAILACTLLGVAACFAIRRHQKKAAGNRLIRQVLEGEVKKRLWEDTGGAQAPGEQELLTLPLSENADNPCWNSSSLPM